MNPQQQRIALGKWAGTKCSGCNDLGYVTTQLSSIPDSDGSITRQCECIPDYLNDLDAVHELEERLDFSAQAKYSHWLWDNVVNKRDTLKTYDWFAHIHASATLRCEALLRTLNLWKD